MINSVNNVANIKNRYQKKIRIADIMPDRTIASVNTAAPIAILENIVPVCEKNCFFNNLSVI